MNRDITDGGMHCPYGYHDDAGGLLGMRLALTGVFRNVGTRMHWAARPPVWGFAGVPLLP